MITATAAGGLFFPQSQSLGIDCGAYSVALLDEIVYAGANHSSFAQSSKDLQKLAEVRVTAKQVKWVCKRIGGERVSARNEGVKAYQELPLSERKKTPAGVTAPQVAAVGCDGGRVQILERSGGPIEAEEASEAKQGRTKKHCREDKIGLMQMMQSKVSVWDPCPEIPESFVDPTRILKLARDLKKQAVPSEEAVQETAEPEAGFEALAAHRHIYDPPEVLEKSFVGFAGSLAGFRPSLGRPGEILRKNLPPFPRGINLPQLALLANVGKSAECKACTSGSENEGAYPSPTHAPLAAPA